MYNLGNLLKELRTKKQVSMDSMLIDLKRLYGISIAKSTISKWENNKAEPTIENAKILCNYFGVTLDFLLGLEENKVKSSSKEINFTEEEVALIEMYRQLDVEEKAELRGELKGIIKVKQKEKVKKEQKQA